MNRKIGLDLARACAISLVLVSHFVKKIEFLGGFGVELFFALSGFLIGGILYRSLMASPRWSFSDVRFFWLRRWWRTLPNYYLFLPAAFAFQYFLAVLPSFQGILPFFVFAQYLFGASTDFYRVSWSLCIEEWFYLLFPLTILLFVRVGRSRRVAFIATMLVFAIAPVVMREFAFLHNPPDVVRTLTWPRLDAIAYGVAMIVLLSRHNMSKKLRLVLVTSGLASVAVLFWLYWPGRVASDSIMFYRIAFVAMPLSFAAMMPYLESLKRLPFGLHPLHDTVTNISKWSYSIYLCHVPILFATYAAFGTARDNEWGNVLSKVVGLALTIIVSRFVYLYYEVRLTAMRPSSSRSD